MSNHWMNMINNESDLYAVSDSKANEEATTKCYCMLS